MTWPEEAMRALKGSIGLILHDPSAIGNFNLTVSGFWRSFSAVLIIAPVYVYAASGHVPGSDGQADRYIAPILAAITLLLQWIFWPVFMAVISPLAGYSKTYARYITVFNWSEVLLAGMTFLPVLIAQLVAGSANAAGMSSLVMLLLSRYLRWYITRITLETNGTAAAALVLADMLAGLLIARLTGLI